MFIYNVESILNFLYILVEIPFERHFRVSSFLFWCDHYRNFSSRTWSFVGGTFALYSLLCRNINIGILSSKSASLNSSHSYVNQSKKPSRLGKFCERSLIARRVLLFIAMLGMCMLIGDGILTPAISGMLAWVGPFSLLLATFWVLVSFPSFIFSFINCPFCLSVLSAMGGLRARFSSVSKCKYDSIQ